MPPGLFIHRDTSGNVTGYSGQMFEHLKWLSARLKFRYDGFTFSTIKEIQLKIFASSYSISPSPGNIAGIKINGTWNGLIGQLVRNVSPPFNAISNFDRLWWEEL